MNDDDDWIEEFYSNLEKSWANYTRPVDYKERAAKLLESKRKPVKNQWEGVKKSKLHVEETKARIWGNFP